MANSKMTDKARKQRFASKIDEKFGNRLYEVLEYTYAKDPCVIRCLTCGKEHTFMFACNIFRNERLCDCASNDIQRFKYEQKIKAKYSEDIRFLEYNGARDKCKFICCKCLSIDTLDNAESLFIRGHICKHCFPGGARGGTSVGELTIEDYLIENNIKYCKQYIFKCKNKDINRKRFDFALLNDKDEVAGIIEFDGKQHFQCTDYFGGEEKYIKIQKSDKIKSDYCLNHDIPMLRIRYDVEDINKVLADFINQINFTKTFNDYRNHA